MAPTSAKFPVSKFRISLKGHFQLRLGRIYNPHRDERVDPSRLSTYPPYLLTFLLFLSSFLPYFRNSYPQGGGLPPPLPGLKGVPLLPPARDTFWHSGLPVRYFFRCYFSHRFLMTFRRPFVPQSSKSKTSQIASQSRSQN